MIIKLVDRAKHSISLTPFTLIDPCVEVNETRSEWSNSHCFESDLKKTLQSGSRQIWIFELSKFSHVHGLLA